jgi:ATP-dependent DNA helicase RecQ
MEKHLKDIYGFNNFRGSQKEIINNLLEKKDVFAILPTGGGKSLLYQFPATFTDKITIVVSPLISLMNDQCKYLNSKNIKTLCLNSEYFVPISQYINYKIIYTTPEFIVSRLQAFILIKEKIGLFAIDEAHCVSQWSHDFRTSYQQLGIIKKKIPQNAVIGSYGHCNSTCFERNV